MEATSEKTKPQLIYAWNYLNWGGAQIYTLALIKEARKTFDVLVVLPRGSDKVFIGFLDEMGVKYEFFSPPADFHPAPTLRRKIQRHWRKLKSETALINRLLGVEMENAIIHIDLSPQQSFIALFRLCLRKQVFVTMHNSFARLSFWREAIWSLKVRALLRSGRFHVFGSNEDCKKYLTHFISETSVGEIKVTRAGIDPLAIGEIMDSDLHRSTLTRRFGISEGKFIVLVVGQFIDRKGRWVFLQAASQLLSVARDIEFVWLMPQLPDETDMSRIENYGLAGSFHIVVSASVGTSRSDHWRFYRLADVFALPSYLEGLPIALLEAMSLGLPCISTNINGIPEAIHHLETGLLIEPGNADELAAAIDKLKNDPAIRHRLADKGRAFVMENFDEREAAKIAALGEYTKCLGVATRFQG